MSTIISREIDVYETEGGVRSSVSVEDDQSSASVEKIESGFQESFSKFENKHIHPGKANFSDSVSRPLQYGFKTELHDYELDNSRKTNETITQRYHRLKLEVTELVNEVEQLQDSKSQLSGANPADVISDLQHLQSSLGQLELDRILKDSSLLTGSGSAPYSVLFKQLQGELSEAKGSSSDETSSGTVYEVYASVEAAKFGHLSKLSELEKRLAALEGLVGKGDSKVSVVAAGLDADYKDISSAVLGLQSKVALLDEAHVSSISGQLNELLVTLQKLGDNKTTTATDDKTDSEHKAKVAEALETVSSIAPMISVIPDVVNRLHTLKDLHEHASQLVNTIASMSGEQGTISEQLSVLKTLLDQVQSSVSSSIQTLQTNFDNLESRINSLQK